MAGRPRPADQIRVLEHDGDRITHDLLSQLERSFVLPFDREDGHRLVSAIDDLLDYIDEAAEHLVIYKVGAPMEHAVTLAGLIRDATRELAAETRLLAHPERLGSGAKRIDELEHEADRTLRSALASLFERETDPLVVFALEGHPHAARERDRQLQPRRQDAGEHPDQERPLARGLSLECVLFRRRASTEVVT